MTVSAYNLAKFLFVSISENPKEANKILKSFLEFIEEKKLTGLLPHVVKFLEKFQKAELDKQTLKITLQQEHKKSVIDEIKKKINAPASVETEVIIDENIKGGFIASFNNIIYDASVATQLEQARNKLTK